MYDSTQSFTDLPGNGAIRTRLGVNGTYSYAANHGRTTFGVRNSRLGFRLKGPETENIKSSALAEMDFLGNQPLGAPNPVGTPAVTEAAFFNNPTFRVRHFMLKMETPIVDLMAGQYWELFGWQSYFHPNTVELQGVPGQIYSRTPQLRLSKIIKTDAVNVEVAIAAFRPPQRDSAVPDGQAGVRVLDQSLQGAAHRRRYRHCGRPRWNRHLGRSAPLQVVPEFAAAPTSTRDITSWGISADLLLPILPAQTVNDGNALTLTASYVYGQSIADLYTGLTGGATFPPLPANAMGAAQTYPQDVDNGLVAFTPDGVLHAIRWWSTIVGLQYYFPTPIRMWVTANYSHMTSPNIDVFASAANGVPATTPTRRRGGATPLQQVGLVRRLLTSSTPPARFASRVDYAYFRQTYLDGTKATNNRVGFSAWYLF